MASANHLGAALVDDGDINILLLGETGVGKSTFINSMVNYLQHETLEDALQDELTCLIPSKFSISDENYESQEVHIGSDENEDAKIGNSSTQGARSYVFPIKDNAACRIIDTPGIGDARGLDKDRENFENLLTYISQYKYLHGICFLLKPNVTVINPYFKFCIIHLLSRLEKSASRNIIFIFTNSRGTFYRPGETLTLLRRVLAEIAESPPHVKIPCAKENIFCVDNEAFKFLAAMKQGIKFGDREKDEFSLSWITSCDAVKSLLKYMEGEKKLMPHQVQDTLSINEARRNILDLAKPLADITEHIRNNLTLLKRHTDELNQEHLSNEDLKKRLFVPGITIEAVELSQPVTVCTSVKCSEVISTGGISHRHYKQRCHNPCYLNNVPKEIIGTPELMRCASMGPRGQCRMCNCSFSIHMHIYYETTTKLVEQEDQKVKSQIMSRDDLIIKKNQIIKETEQKSKEFENEKQVILKTMAKFAFFLHENSISPYNDAYLQYINYLIEREQSLGENADKELLKNYNELKVIYQAEMDILNDAKQNASSLGSKLSVMSISEVYDAIKHLFSLRLTGKAIEDFYTKQRKLKKHEVTTKEYVHPRKISLLGAVTSTVKNFFTWNSKNGNKSGKNDTCQNCSNCSQNIKQNSKKQNHGHSQQSGPKQIPPVDLTKLTKKQKKAKAKKEFGKSENSTQNPVGHSAQSDSNVKSLDDVMKLSLNQNNENNDQNNEKLQEEMVSLFTQFMKFNQRLSSSNQNLAISTDSVNDNLNIKQSPMAPDPDDSKQEQNNEKLAVQNKNGSKENMPTSKQTSGYSSQSESNTLNEDDDEDDDNYRKDFNSLFQNK